MSKLWKGRKIYSDNINVKLAREFILNLWTLKTQIVLWFRAFLCLAMTSQNKTTLFLVVQFSSETFFPPCIFCCEKIFHWYSGHPSDSYSLNLIHWEKVTCFILCSCSTIESSAASLHFSFLTSLPLPQVKHELAYRHLQIKWRF